MDFIRSDKEIARFADSVEIYINQMKTNCSSLEGNLDILCSNVKDEKGIVAAKELQAMIDLIKEDLPAANELVLVLRKEVEVIKRADGITMKRRR